MTARWDRIAASLDVEGLSIAIGASSIVGAVSKFGAHFDLDTAELPTSLTTAVLASGGVYPYPSVAGALEVVSSDAADAAAGTGMRTVLIMGLDAEWLLKSEIVTLNGITPVALPGTWIRTHRMYGITAGSGKVNVGTVTVRPSGGGVTLLDIPPDFGQSVHGIFTVPADRRGFFKTWKCVHLPKAAVEAVHAHVAIVTRENDQADRPFRVRQTSSTGTPNPFVVPVEIPPMTDIEMRVLTVDANNTQIAGTFQLVLAKLEEVEA